MMADFKNIVAPVVVVLAVIAIVTMLIFWWAGEAVIGFIVDRWPVAEVQSVDTDNAWGHPAGVEISDYSYVAIRVEAPLSKSLPSYRTHRLLLVNIDSVDCYKVRIVTRDGDYTIPLTAPARVDIYESKGGR